MPVRPTPTWWRDHSERLNLRRKGGELVGPCPNCGTGDNRFAVRLSDGLLNCRICGGFKRILRAAGWEKKTSPSHLDLKVTRAPRKLRKSKPNGEANGEANGRIVRQWGYATAAGASVAIRRTDRPGHPKTIERSPPGIKGPYLPLIRSPYDGYEGPSVIVEGEVAADAVLEAGYAAICWINGSNALNQTDWNGIREMDIVLWPDADDPGRMAMEELAIILKKQDCSVRLVDTSDLSNGDDAVDVIKSFRPEMIEDALPWRVTPPRGATNLVRFEFVRDTNPPEQILPRYIERDAVSVIGGRGGTAKSSRLVIEALALVSGQEGITDVTPELQYKVAHLGLEEGTKTFTGRMVAASDYFGVPSDVVEERLYLFKGEDWYAKLGGESGWTLIDWMADQLRNSRIDVLMADPLSFLSEGDLNNPKDSVAVMQQLTTLAQRANVGIRVIHHANKGKDEPHIDNIRGAGAITDHARVADLITAEKDAMTKRKVFTMGEAEKRNNMGAPDVTHWRIIVRDDWPIMIRHTEAVNPMASILPEERTRALDHLLGCPPAHRRADERAIGWSGQAISDCFREDWGRAGVGSTKAKERSREQNECRGKAREILRAWLREGAIEQSMEKVSGKICSIHSAPRWKH